jgi:hypothetical protein
MEQKTWEVNGLTLELDLEDAMVMERYEAAFERMAQDEAALPKDGKASDRIRAYCRMFHRLYDALFGEGTAEKLFGERMSAAECDEVYESFLAFVQGQLTASAERRAKLLMKYKPNRAARRNA